MSLHLNTINRIKLGIRFRLCLILAFVAALLFMPLGAIAQSQPMLELHFINVQQGDATLIRSPSGKVALVDMGPPSASSNLIKYLEQLRITRLNLLVLTHAHLDHLGSWKAILGRFPVGIYVDPGFPHTSKYYKHMLEHIRSKKIRTYRAEINQILDLGSGTNLRVLAPPREHLRNTRSDVNANSVVLRVEYKWLRVLLTGDAERPTEKHLLKNPQWLPSQILKVAHHGSRHSSTKSFLTQTRPQVSVISCARDNDYGHPHKDTLKRLRQHGSKIYITARHGHIIARSDGKKLWISTRGRSLREADHIIDLKPPDMHTPVTPHTPNAKTKARPTPPPSSDDENKEDDEYKSDKSTIPSLGQQPERKQWMTTTPQGKESALSSPAPSPNGYVSAKNSRYFHRSSCLFAHSIPEKNRIKYSNRKAALRAGKQPASDCLP
jgi:beta-lactamase superfamily II metal-dependent hydrolase